MTWTDTTQMLSASVWVLYFLPINIWYPSSPLNSYKLGSPISENHETVETKRDIGAEHHQISSSTSSHMVSLHASPGRLTRRDGHNERCLWQVCHPPCLLQPGCSTPPHTWGVQTQLRLQQCRDLPSLVLAHVPSVCASVTGQQRCQQTALKNMSRSSRVLQIQQNPQQIA